MSRLIDPSICPDCRSRLDSAARCTGCNLSVTGPLAGQLWSLMVTADGLVERLRVTGSSAGAGNVPASPAAAAGPHAPLPQHPAPQHPAPLPLVSGSSRRTLRLPSASVPVVLLSLGALCLLVAAIVFVAVAWDLLGLTGRTMVLLGVTGVLAVVATVLSRKALRGAAEAFWVVVAGMLSVDLLGARSADLLGLAALSWRGTSALVGGVLVVLGAGVGLWARRQPVTRLYGAEIVAVIGATVLCTANAWGAQHPAISTTVAVPMLAALAVLLRRRLAVAAYGITTLGALSWLVLLGIGWDRTLEMTTLTQWWSDVRGWPLVASALFAAAAVLLVKAPELARQAGAALALFPLVLLVNGPATPGSTTRDLMVACATVVALGLVASLAPRVWALGAGVLTAAGTGLLGMLLLAGPWFSLGRLDLEGQNPADRTLTGQDEIAAWAAGVVALSVVVAALCLLRRVPVALGSTAVRVFATLAPATLTLGALVVLLELEPPLWTAVLAAAVATTSAGAATWWSRDHVLAAGLGSAATAYLTVVLLWAAVTNEILIAATTVGLFLVLSVVAVLRERRNGRLSAAVAGSLAGLFGGWALVALGRVLDADTEAIALALAAYAAMVALLAAPTTRRTTTRLTLEATAVTLAVLATGFSGDDRTTAMVLTILGTAICLVTATTGDRDTLGWGGAAVLGIATLVRLDADVAAPELYTLPAAALLVAAGGWRLHQDRETSSFTFLGSGLTLALLPSLLLALEEPASLRGALIGAAGVLVLAVGVQQRLSAPFVLGAGTTSLLALRHLQPVAEAVPRWMSLGGVGLLLLVVGVTWEARRRDVEQAQRYLTELR